MNNQIQKNLTSLGDSFAELLGSITVQNAPSINAASSLLAADSELTSSLDALRIHQRNHERILALRQEAEDLESKLKDRIRTLADLRQEVIATPIGNTTSNGLSDTAPAQVSAKELIAYAKRIAKFTQPPAGGAPQMPKVPRAEDGQQAATANQKDATRSPGLTPQDAVRPGATQAEKSAQDSTGDKQGVQPGISPLSEEFVQWLNPALQVNFQPYANEEILRRGAMARLQAQAVEQKRDLEMLLLEEMGDGAAGMGVTEDVAMVDVGSSSAPGAQQNRSVAAGTEREKPKPVSLGLYESDDDDD